MSDRRTFLRGLAALPLIGGGVALIGDPTAAAVPVSPALLESYRTWLHFEGRAVAWEMAKADPRAFETITAGIWHRNPGALFHNGAEPPPSTRAAVILSAAGVPFPGRQAHG